MEETDMFIREFELESLGESLTLYQKEVGDVSCVVWDASIVLARYLEIQAQKDPAWLKGKTVLELGAGVGCVGLTAACLGANVTLTDLPEVLSLLEKNVSANEKVWAAAGGKAKVQELRWGSGDTAKPNILLLADCVYYAESVEPLIKTLHDVADTETEIFLCQEERETDKQRIVWKEFQKQLFEQFQFEKVPLSEQHPQFSCSEIVILKGSPLR